MSESYNTINLFGCSVVSANAQFGLNQNPTIFTVKVAKDTLNNQIFSLPRGSTRSLVDLSLGSLSIRGIVQSVEEQTINISGSGVFTIKITDTKPVLDAAQVFLNASSNSVNLGENIISITPEVDSDFERGLRFAYIKTYIENATIKYGNENFRVDLSRISLPNRGTDTEYRIQGTSITLLELIQQTMSDNGFEWYVETNTSNVISVIPIDRSSDGINLSALKGDENVIRQTDGFENRDTINRSVIIGSQRQVLAFVDGPRFTQFWGFDNNGVPLTVPTFSIVYQNGQKVTKTTSEQEIRSVLNRDVGVNDVGKDYFDALRQYGNEFWGRKFWFRITASQIDSQNNPWVDVISAGFWEEDSGDRRPDNMPKDGMLKFGTDDGRWTAFVKLPSPAKRIQDRLKISWADSVRLNQGVLVTEFGQWYMKCSVERFGTYIVVTLNTPLAVTQNDQAGVEREDIVEDRRTELAKAWIPILDKRRHYGPWSFEPVSKSGKTELVVDSSINPWNFGYRDISLSEAVANQQKVAMARLRAIVLNKTEIDTAELEVTGLPRVNIGTIIGNGTNITGINVNFGVDSVITTYRANVFTGELTRLNKAYQDLVDSLRRKNRKLLDNFFGPVNYPAVTQEITTLKKENDSGIPQKDIDSFAEGKLCKVIDHDDFFLGIGPRQPFYKLQEVREVVTNGGITYAPLDIRFLQRVRNKSEPDNQPGRVPLNTIVTAFRSKANNSAYYFEYSPNPPTVSQGTIVQRVGTRLYEVVLTIADDRLTENELNALGSVENIGEPSNSPGRLIPGSTVEITWLTNSDGTLIPQINAPVNVFGNPGS